MANPEEPEGDTATSTAEAVRGGDMPPLQYRLIHRDASLSQAEREELVQGLTATLQPVVTR